MNRRHVQSREAGMIQCLGRQSTTRYPPCQCSGNSYRGGLAPQIDNTPPCCRALDFWRVAADNPHMYSLLVSAEVDGLNNGTFTVSASRFLECTDQTVKTQLHTLSKDAVECLHSWPCLLMNEGRSVERACVAKLESVKHTAGAVMIRAKPIPGQPVLINDTVWKLRADLELEQLEFSRHHFAVKDRDLLAVLASAGHDLPSAATSHFRKTPLPAPSRSQLIAAIDQLAEWSHADLDRLLLEVGVDGLHAPQTLGGEKQRATAIVQYAIENPGSTTAENDLLAALIVGRVQSRQPDSSRRSSLSQQTETTATAAPRGSGPSPTRVFVVHGRNDTARQEVVAFLTSHGLEAIVLHDQPNMGRHLLTKFIAEAELVAFAVVLMTADDVGAANEEPLAPRARQNVILELGYFLSHLGQSRVCAIKSPGLETPSDFDGIVYISMDTDGGWKSNLLRELRAAELPVTLS